MADSDDENFVTFGSALEPLDEENLPRKKPVTIEDQYALDAQGRRRFHGAFTGGFSAGYFNSVGTRDGWRPQEFKSSRSRKAGGVSQRVEDFMDEEDTGEFGIAPTAIRANTDFTDHGRKGLKRERPRQDNDGPIPGVPVLKELLKPVKDTVGVTLLKKMGWRPGQGIGPRVTKLQKTKTRENNEKMKIYGCSMPNQPDKTDEIGSDGSEDDSEDILFAPDDYEPFRCNPKDNYFGIGYTGLDRRPVLSGHLNLFEPTAFKLLDKNKKLSIRGQAFGVGAFEADDEDIYQRDDMSRYDFALGTSVTKNKSRWSENNEAETSKENCLCGFASAKNRLERKKIFEPPELPRDFKAFHVVRKSKFHPPIEPSSEARKKGLGRRDLNADDRSVMIGDAGSSVQNNSMEICKNTNEDVSKGSRVSHNIISRTLNLYGKNQIEERRQLLEAQKSSSTSSGASWREKLTSDSFVKGGVEGSDPLATGSLKTFRDFNNEIGESSSKQFSRPFPTDSEKQKRFEKFLDLNRRGESEKLSQLQPLSMTEWERDHERDEFAQASRMLEKSSRIDDETFDRTEKILNDPTINEKFVGIGADEPAPSAAKTLDDQMKNAARMKLFGKLTREREPWQPVTIVCKRFNIPEPRTGRSKPVNQTKNKRQSVFDCLDFAGNSGRFERATDTSGSFEEPHIPYKNKPNRSPIDVHDSTNAFRVFDVSDIDAGRRATEKIRSFEESYEKIFGRGLPTVGTSGEGVVVDSGGAIEEIAGGSVVEDTRMEISGVKVKDVEKKDLFKAIFLSSSSEDSGDDEEDDSEAVKSLLIGKAPGELNVRRNNSPPRGIFAKLDLDSLTRSGKNDEPSKSGRSTMDRVENEETKESLDKRVVDGVNDDGRLAKEPEVQQLPPDVYGPVLPSKIVRKGETPVDLAVSSSKNLIDNKTFFKSVVVAKVDEGHVREKVEGKWVERTRVKKSKKDKHKHKHKEKERSRHKHKKKDKR